MYTLKNDLSNDPTILNMYVTILQYFARNVNHSRNSIIIFVKYVKRKANYYTIHLSLRNENVFLCTINYTIIRLRHNCLRVFSNIVKVA